MLKHALAESKQLSLDRPVIVEPRDDLDPRLSMSQAIGGESRTCPLSKRLPRDSARWRSRQ